MRKAEKICISKSFILLESLLLYCRRCFVKLLQVPFNDDTLAIISYKNLENVLIEASLVQKFGELRPTLK